MGLSEYSNEEGFGLLGYDAVSLGVFCDVENHPPKDTVSYPRTLQYSEAEKYEPQMSLSNEMSNVWGIS